MEGKKGIKKNAPEQGFTTDTSFAKTPSRILVRKNINNLKPPQACLCLILSTSSKVPTECVVLLSRLRDVLLELLLDTCGVEPTLFDEVRLPLRLRLWLELEPLVLPPTLDDCL